VKSNIETLVFSLITAYIFLETGFPKAFLGGLNIVLSQFCSVQTCFICNMLITRHRVWIGNWIYLVVFMIMILCLQFFSLQYDGKRNPMCS
jgi:predicted neutral ceramidase superfamily lipid hydrolase